MNTKNTDVLRMLATQIREITSDNRQKETINSWKKLNALQPERPMVIIDQVPWHEFDWGQDQIVNKEGLLHDIEVRLRTQIYAAENYRCDKVFWPEIRIPKIIKNSRIGPTPIVDEIGLAKHYVEQIKNMEDVNALRAPQVEVDPASDLQKLEEVSAIFDGIMPVKLVGGMRHSGLWDIICELISPNSLLYDVIDRPDYISALIAKFVEMENNVLDQFEDLGLLEPAPDFVHCCGAFSDELPSKNYDGQKAKAEDCWTFTMAQMFSEISPEMHDEFDIEPLKPLLERYGLVYYGCCEPLHDKIKFIRKIKNVRKISISPWANKEKAAQEIKSDYVFSNKPNPAFMASEEFDENLVRNDLRETLEICKQHKTPCELILKDISTIRKQPERLAKWEQIAMEEVARIK